MSNTSLSSTICDLGNECRAIALLMLMRKRTDLIQRSVCAHLILMLDAVESD